MTINFQTQITECASYPSHREAHNSLPYFFVDGECDTVSVFVYFVTCSPTTCCREIKEEQIVHENSKI